MGCLYQINFLICPLKKSSFDPTFSITNNNPGRSNDTINQLFEHIKLPVCLYPVLIYGQSDLH